MTQSMGTDNPSRARLRSADLRAHHGGGGLFTRYVNQYLGSLVASAAARAGVHPSVLTLLNLVVGVACAVVGILGAQSGALVPALVVLIGLQLAYSIDCADGQLARATGTSSTAGGRLDILVDVAVRAAVAGVVLASAAAWTNLPAAVGGAFVVVWTSPLVLVLLTRGDADFASVVKSTSWPVAILKASRDYGLHVFALGIVMAVRPSLMAWFVIVVMVPNAVVLLVNIATQARASMRAGPTTQA